MVKKMVMEQELVIGSHEVFHVCFLLESCLLEGIIGKIMLWDERSAVMKKNKTRRFLQNIPTERKLKGQLIPSMMEMLIF